MRAKSSERQRAEKIEARLTEVFDGIGVQYNRPRAMRDGDALQGAWAEVRALSGELDRLAKDQHKAERRSPRGLSPDARHDKRYFRGVRSRLRKWRSAAGARDALDQARPQPLYDHETPASTHHSQHLNAMDSALRLLHRAVNPLEQDGAAEEMGAFPDIPLRASSFIANCHVAYRICLAQRRATAPRFLDVGCGIGMTLIMAARFFESLTGLEIDPGYAEAARNLVSRAGLNKAQVIDGNALAFTDFGAFDVIYFYQPMNDAKKLLELENKILREARKGTVLIAPYQDFNHRHNGKGCAGFGHYVFVAGLDEDEAADLRAETELIGTAIYDPMRDDFRNVGYLKGFLELCRRNGIRFGSASEGGNSRDFWVLRTSQRR